MSKSFSELIGAPRSGAARSLSVVTDQTSQTNQSADSSHYSSSDDESLVLTLPFVSWTCCLTVLFVAIMVAIFMLGIALTLTSPATAAPQRVRRAGADNQTCAKRRCTWLMRTLNGFSPDSAPCDDFYRHVCRTRDGRWLSRTSHMDFDVNSAVSRLFRKPLSPKKPGTAAQKAASLYSACTNVLRRDRSEMGDLRSFMRKMGLDLLATSDKSKKDAVDVMCALFFRYGINTLLSFVLHDLIAVNGKKLVSVSFSRGFDAWIVKREKLIAASRISHFYVHYVNAYHNSSRNDTWDVLSRVSDADNVACSLLASFLRKREAAPARIRIRHLSRFTQSTVSSQEWVDAFAVHSGSEYAVDDVVYANPAALKFFDALVSRLDHDGVKCEIAWCLLREYGSYADRRLISSVARHNQTCLERVAAVMGPALYGTYIFRQVSAKTIRTATDMALNIRRQAELDIARATWLDAKSKHQALKKIQNITFHIGFQKGMRTTEELDSYYLKYPFSAKHFLLSWLRASKLTRAKRLGNRNMLLPHRAFPTAAYVGQANAVFISADLLRPPVFLPAGPESFNYGGLGQIIAHEIFHAFLISTKGFDKKRAHRREQGTMQDKMRCLKRSHDEALQGATLPQRRHSDAENVADLAGATVAFRTYANLSGRNGTASHHASSEEQRQMFFVGLCLKHCEHEESDASLFTPSPLRCIVQLRNMREFSTAYRCHGDDPMNAATKCSVI
ncbi:endothelin-converting enzyme 1-like [Dermacentor andersoni]|uniref:endothelin-converting enzyme 1-like n=1 Tax=Dermacentor andersoni TaxID=34620 RepID=UPI002155ED34